MESITSKKVLFLGNGMHYKGNAAITLSNLFSNWPKENISIAAPLKNAVLSSDYGYQNVYSLGHKEYNYRFPLSVIKQKYFSGPLPATDVSNSGNRGTGEEHDLQPSNKRSLIYPLLQRVSGTSSKILEYTGCYYFLDRLTLSDELKKWIAEQNPDFIYTVLPSLGYISLTREVHDVFKKPVIIHIMDDWASTCVEPGPLSSYWKKRFDREYRELLDLSCKRIAISQKMAEEYEERYGGEWTYFHNPIDTSKWLPFQKTTYDIESPVKIGFLGSIRKSHSHTIERFVEVVRDFTEFDLEFHIYSQLEASKERNISYHSFVEHSRVPEVLSSFDLLLLPLDFSEDYFNYARLSLPTKASEYLISGVPTLLIAPEGMAITEFFREKRCGFVIDSNDPGVIKETLADILNDQSQRERVAKTGKQVAEKLFDVENVQQSFYDVFKI